MHGDVLISRRLRVPKVLKILEDVQETNEGYFL